MTDWNLWLSRYERPHSPHSQRLATVQRLIARRIDRTAPHPMSVLSICAGDGRDIIQVLAERSDASRVAATLVELDPRLCALARAQASEHGLAGVHVREADAGATDTYADISPADLVILVGVFGNISDPDVRTTIETLPAFCKPGALVIWSLRQQPRRDRAHEAGASRHNDHHRVETVRQWFEAEGFRDIFSNRSDAAFHVGAHRFVAETPTLPAGRRFFTFDLPKTADLPSTADHKKSATNAARGSTQDQDCA